MAKNLKQAFDDVRSKISETATKCGRKSDEITLIAVSKTKPIEQIKEAYSLGQIHFGENYIQELVEKHDRLKELNIKWHFIGHIQTNKVKDVVGRAHLIHTLDRPKLAYKIQAECLKRNITQNCLIQIKLTDENTKTGCSLENIDDLVESLKECPNIHIQGLMTIGSLTNNIEQTQSEYKELSTLIHKLNQHHFFSDSLSILSMGMSNDYDIAIQEGATHVRVGSSLFGAREKSV